MSIGKALRQNDQRAPRPLSLLGDGFFDLRVVVDWGQRHHQSEGWGGGFDRAVEQWRKRRGVRVEDDGNPRNAWGHLLEELEPFSHQLGIVFAEPRDVPAGSGEALNKAQPDGIDDQYEHDWYRSSLLSEGRYCGRAPCQNDIGRKIDQLRRIGLEESRTAGGEAIDGPDIPVANPSEACQCITEARRQFLSIGVILG